MAQFHTLTVTGIHRTIRDAIAVTLQPDDPEAFSFTQGQYLTFRRAFDGVELRRSYSICAAPGEPLQVGIKRVDGGTFSTWANTELRVGDTLDAMPPMGQFYAAAKDNSPHYLAFAGGSGITPVLSILRTGLQAEPDARFTLVYANRSPSAIMFLAEIEDLKNLHMGRLAVIHVLEDDSQDIDLFHGRVDAEKCAALFKDCIDVESVSMVFICGPEPMMLTIAESLKQHGLTKEQIRFELFASGQPGRAPRKAAAVSANPDGTPGRVILNGESRSLTIAPGKSLLDAARASDIDAPFACTAGVCSTCKCKIIEGEVDMIANHALEDYEVEAGFVLSCQSYPVSERVVWDYDQAGH